MYVLLLATLTQELDVGKVNVQAVASLPCQRGKYWLHDPVLPRDITWSYY